MSPSSISSSRSAQRRIVDLPEPEAPITATASCSAISRSIPCRTSRSPKALVTPRNSRTGAAVSSPRRLRVVPAVEQPRERDRDREVEQRRGDQRRVVEVGGGLDLRDRGTPRPLTPMIAIRATSFCRAMKSLSSGGPTLRTACGRITWRIAWRSVSPIASAAVALARVHRAQPGAVDLARRRRRRRASSAIPPSTTGSVGSPLEVERRDPEPDQVDEQDRSGCRGRRPCRRSRAAARGNSAGALDGPQQRDDRAPSTRTTTSTMQNTRMSSQNASSDVRERVLEHVGS